MTAGEVKSHARGYMEGPSRRGVTRGRTMAPPSGGPHPVLPGMQAFCPKPLSHLRMPCSSGLGW